VIHILKVKELVNGTIQGNEDLYIKGPCSIKDGKNGFIAYIKNTKYTKYLNTTLASIIIVDDSVVIPKNLKKTIIKVKNASLAFIDYLNLYNQSIQIYSIDNNKGVQLT
jgi:UDP-3-O-[3-hydroxymyristoyl] glucosamine N-acyltransferase